MDISSYQHMNIRMSTRGKRPLRNLTPGDKVRAIQRIHNGETKASVSRDIGVPESTLRGWCKNEQKLLFMCRQLGGADQMGPMSGMETPPEKRPRFENHIQTPKFPSAPGFDEFAYSRLPLNGRNYTANGNNAILEKIAFNEIMKKHVLPNDNGSQKKTAVIGALPNQLSAGILGSMPLGSDYAQLSMIQNLNLLSLLNPGLSNAMPNFATGNGIIDDPKDKTAACSSVNTIANDLAKDNIKNNNISNSSNGGISNNNNNNNMASLTVKNWARDPADNSSISSVDGGGSGVVDNGKQRTSNNDSNNNTVNEKHAPSNSVALETTESLGFPPPPLPLGLLQIPNIINASDPENTNSALLDWCKIFNASLNFLALAAAAAALQPNASLSVGGVSKNDSERPEDNILYKELTKTARQYDSPTNQGNAFMNSDVSSDSYFDSEPEDLSIRFVATSKLSSPANSRSQSPIKSNGSYSPLPSDTD
ncbi:protein distal antenna-related [Glossina fuscipes]|uniref:Protein distal antenna-related n=1 Tax=Glossina fuscipes TaxID=7396 RepID=A0A9C5ZIF9_9MUSC|nr:protein distal antenna-related [Glossina fuscipes]